MNRGILTTKLLLQLLYSSNDKTTWIANKWHCSSCKNPFMKNKNKSSYNKCNWNNLVTNSRVQSEMLLQKETLLQEKETRLAAELAESRFFARVRSMAEKLQKREEELAKERQALHRKMQECEECERHLQKWQHELDSTAARMKERNHNNKGAA